ncbi:PQQ-like beta-propeller repeat protein [Halorussus gelatinilyticus]|uniref:PQQ-like beta-propeller repeat protein n=1 Tax=Halorussus gelatinilyticus TaxID=2937524 RepID=A0A8U0IGI6_9EURY|nr:PQQ-binding-like beta-propeller repeat protein [Halorussus gelatinilyticus]UPW00190.1 PQQ-like beta-propeller repeat protein [Halorussus gelatinilyticus]
MSPDEPSTTRRAFLAATGTTAVAGCSGPLSASGSTATTTNDETTSEQSAGNTRDWPQIGRTETHNGYVPALAADDEPSASAETTVSGSLTTPTVVGDTVFVTRGAPGTDGPEATLEAYALASGERLWQTEVGDGEWTQETSPILLDGTLIVPQSDGSEVSVHGLDADTGDVRWHVSTAATRIRGPVAASSHLVVTTAGRHPNQTGESPVEATLRVYEL